MKVTKLTMTCGACPSQWEGTTENNLNLYVRYRWGHISASLWKGPILEGESVWAYNEEVGGPFDGRMDESEMKKILTEAGLTFTTEA